MREAMRHAKAHTKRQAVLAAMEDFNRRHRQGSLIKHLGTCRNMGTAAELSHLRQARMKRHGAC